MLITPLRPAGDKGSGLEEEEDPTTSRRGLLRDCAIGVASNGGCEAGDGGGDGSGERETGARCASRSKADSPSRETVKRPKASRPEATTYGHTTVSETYISVWRREKEEMVGEG